MHLLPLILFLDLTIFALWAIIYIVLIARGAGNATLYAPYLTVHSSYAIHLTVCTMRLIAMHSHAVRTNQEPRTTSYTTSAFGFALLFDVFNIATTHLFTSQAVLWAWAMDLAIAYAFVFCSFTLFVYSINQ